MRLELNAFLTRRSLANDDGRSPHLINIMHTVICLVLCVFLSHSLKAQDQRAFFTELLSLGDDEETGREYLFAGPRLVVVDSESNFYVADAHNVEIKKFNWEGVFQRIIGSRGKGPGELQDVSGMMVDENDNLVIVDRFNQRATLFSNEGGFLKSYPFPEEQYLDVHSAFLLKDGSFILSYKVPHFEKGPDPAPELFHVFEKDFSATSVSFGDFGDFYDTENRFNQALSLINPIHSTTDGQNYVYVSPFFYEGSIYRLDLNEGGLVSSTFEGYNPPFPAYTLLDAKKRHSGRNTITFRHAAYGKYSANTQKWSLGLFILSDGRLVHFSKIGNKEERTYGVEVFSKEGTYQGYFPIEGYVATGADPIVMVPLAVDQMDRFYIADIQKGVPVLRVVKLEFDGLLR